MAKKEVPHNLKTKIPNWLLSVATGSQLPHKGGFQNSFAGHSETSPRKPICIHRSLKPTRESSHRPALKARRWININDMPQASEVDNKTLTSTHLAAVFSKHSASVIAMLEDTITIHVAWTAQWKQNRNFSFFTNEMQCSGLSSYARLLSLISWNAISMSDELNPPEFHAESQPSPKKRSSILARLILLGLAFLAATYLVAYPGLESPPVSEAKLQLMILSAPLVMLSAFAFPSFGDPVATGVLLAAIMVPLVLIVFIKLFRNELGIQLIATVMFGLLYGLASRICFLVAQSLST